MMEFLRATISGIIIIVLNICFFRMISEFIAAIIEYIESKKKKG